MSSDSNDTLNSGLVEHRIGALEDMVSDHSRELDEIKSTVNSANIQMSTAIVKIDLLNQQQGLITKIIMAVAGGILMIMAQNYFGK